MQMIHCPNCCKLTGFKRDIGFGTFFLVVITGGLWLLAVLFYPSRCIVCGLTSSAARGSRKGLAIVFLLILATIIGLLTRTGKSNNTSGLDVGGEASSPVRHIYTIAQIIKARNDIQTGTELNVEGTINWITWDNTSECVQLFLHGTVKIEHGQADPRTYCRYIYVLQGEGRQSAGMLKCNMGADDYRASKLIRQYTYGSRVIAHGTYASSLDFNMVPEFMGKRFGVPVLDNCTLELLSKPPSLPKKQEPLIHPVPQESESKTIDKMARAIEETNFLPENRFKRYPVDSEVEDDVRKALSKSRALRSSTITLVSLHREVTLSGTVVDEPSRELAEDIVSHVEGVVAVHNNLTVGGVKP